VKFLIDQQLPRSLVAFIRSRGHEAAHIKDLGLAEADDRVIWREARRMGAAIISRDGDFSQALIGIGSPQIVWVRLGNCSNVHLMSRFGEVWDRIVEELESGASLLELR